LSRSKPSDLIENALENTCGRYAVLIQKWLGWAMTGVRAPRRADAVRAMSDRLLVGCDIPGTIGTGADRAAGLMSAGAVPGRLALGSDIPIHIVARRVRCAIGLGLGRRFRFDKMSNLLTLAALGP
jgi:hypothetical protein